MEEARDLNRLKVILAEKKKTNKWLAEQLGCAPTTVSKWCTNSSQPSLESIEKIANLLDIDYTELIRIDRKPLRPRTLSPYIQSFLTASSMEQEISIWGQIQLVTSM